MDCCLILRSHHFTHMMMKSGLSILFTQMFASENISIHKEAASGCLFRSNYFSDSAVVWQCGKLAREFRKYFSGSLMSYRASLMQSNLNNGFSFCGCLK